MAEAGQPGLAYSLQTTPFKGRFVDILGWHQIQFVQTTYYQIFDNLSKQQLELPPECQNSVILVFGGQIGNPPDPDMAKSIVICPHLVVRNVIPRRILQNTVIKPAIFKEKARMCLKVQEPWPMPQETVMVGRAILKEDCPYRLIGEKMFDKFHQQD